MRIRNGQKQADPDPKHWSLHTRPPSFLDDEPLLTVAVLLHGALGKVQGSGLRLDVQDKSIKYKYYKIIRIKLMLF